MALVAAKCTMCGSELTVDSSLKSAKCTSCGTEYIVQDAINYHNTYNVTNIEHAGSVIVKDESSVDSRIENATANLIQHKNYARAKEIFQSVVNDKSGDFRGWWGLARAESEDFTLYNCSQSRFNTIKNNVDGALRVAPPEVKNQLQQQWSTYEQSVNQNKQLKTNEQNTYRNKKSSAMAQKQSLENRILGLQQEKDRYISEKGKNLNTLYHPLKGVIVAGVFFIFCGVVSLSTGVGSALLMLLIGAVMVGGMGFRYFSAKSAVSTLEQKIADKDEEMQSVQNEIRRLMTDISQMDKRIENLQNYIF